MHKAAIPRLLISGAASAVGKSLVTLGLAYELRKRGLGVAICTTNSNISLALVYRRLSGRYVHSLDPHILSAGQITQALYQASVGADIVLIDGSGPLYDGSSAGIFEGSDSDIAALTRTPTVLVMDGRSGGNSLGAALKGFVYYAQGFDLVGAVINRVYEGTDEDLPEARDRAFFDTVMRSMRLPGLVGAVPEAPFDVPEMPQRVMQEFNYGALPRQFFIDLSALIQRSLNIDELLQIAQRAPALEVLPTDSAEERRIRIAVSDDACFGLCFQDNLDLLRHCGAELVGFSPVADQKLPVDIGGIYLTGGYLDEYGADLANNTLLMGAIREFAQSGGAVYAEGAAGAYVADRFRIGDHYLSGVGLVPGVAEPQPEGVHYCEGVTTAASVLGPGGLLCKGITTDRWHFPRAIPLLKCMQIAKLHHRASPEGYVPHPHTVVTFSLWHWGSCPELAANFVEMARVWRGANT